MSFISHIRVKKVTIYEDKWDIKKIISIFYVPLLISKW